MRRSGWVFLGVLSVGVPALAAAGEGGAFPSCGSRAPTADDVAAAKKTFELANRYLGEADYDRAIRYYLDAYRTDCTAHKLLGYVARAHELKGEREEAVRALEVYLERSPKADDRATVERRIANLKAQLAAAPPEPTPPPAPASSVAPAPPPAEERPPVQRADAPPPHGGPSFLPWVVVGVGLTTAAAGGALYGFGTSQVNDAEAACGGFEGCLPAVAAKGNGGRDLQIVGVTMLAAGGAAVASGLVWRWLTRRPESHGAAPFRLVPAVGVVSAGVTVDACF
jgi:hypothetical protein